MSPLPCPLAIAAHKHGAIRAIDSAEQQLTYAQLENRVIQLAKSLRRLGIRRGERVGLLATVNANTVIGFWALLRIGATVCPVNPRWPSAAIQQAWRLTDTHRILSDREWAEMIDATYAQPAVIPTEIAKIDTPLATIVFSSGSQTSPKAIAHQLDAHLASARGANTNLPLSTGDGWLLSLPMFHVSGLGVLFRCTLAGATIVLPTSDPSIVGQVERGRPTHVSLVPTQLSRWLAHAHHAANFLKAVLLGGAPLPSELIERAWVAGWPLYTTYGLSETASQVTTTQPNASIEELRTAGRVLPGRVLKIASNNEILVRGATMFDGYLDGQTTTCPFDSDGWFHTGDLGHWDTAGRLVVFGRRDNLFVSGGENIYPEEIELALLNVPGIHQVIVVPQPHQEYGQRPVAFVDGDLAQIDRWRHILAERLPRYKIPDRYLSWPEQFGLKPNRRDLQRLAAQGDPLP